MTKIFQDFVVLRSETLTVPLYGSCLLTRASRLEKFLSMLDKVVVFEVPSALWK
jgi:uncharacterized Rmd1/YagE family protein